MSEDFEDDDAGITGCEVGPLRTLLLDDQLRLFHQLIKIAVVKIWRLQAHSGLTLL
jgi:hypothetical protein